MAKAISFENASMYMLGAMFGVGMSFGGMLDNNVLLNFFTFDYNWDPSFLFVFGVSFLSFSAIVK
jgi:hypothetical protein